jgi:peptidoglycan hydrolase-like protein with peptidoglycan-binding domain
MPAEAARSGKLTRAAVGVLASTALVGGLAWGGAEPAAAKPIGYGWPKLSKGESGKAVVRLQRELSAYGRNVPDTGYYGKQTKKRVKQLQRKNGWRVTGVAGNRVWHELLSDGNRVNSPALAGGGSRGGGGGKGASNRVWDRLAECESGGNWHINTGNGYYGGLQFSLSTWRGYGGNGMPHRASRAGQIRIAEKVQNAQGWGAWPSCSSQIGLR